MAKPYSEDPDRLIVEAADKGAVAVQVAPTNSGSAELSYKIVNWAFWRRRLRRLGI
jgi:hypothetical protein